MLGSFRVWLTFSPAVNKLKDWSFHSKTVAWGYFKIAVGSLSLLVSLFSDILHDPSVQSSIGALNLPPKYALGLSILGVITLYVRMTGSHNPVSQTPTMGSGP